MADEDRGRRRIRTRTASRKVKESRRIRATAYHEAGHAVAKHFLDLRVRRVTIVPNLKDGTAGSCSGRNALSRRHDPESASFHDQHQWRMERDVMVSLAGDEAAQMFSGRRNNVGASSDRRHANDLLHYYTPELDRQVIWRGTKVWLHTEEFRTHFKLLRLKTRRLLSFRWKAVESLARHLLEKKTLSGAEVVVAITEPYQLQSSMPEPPKGRAPIFR